MSGIVIGEVFSHSHMARELCCLSDKDLNNYGGLYSINSLNYPKNGYWPIKMTRIEKNWDE